MISEQTTTVPSLAKTGTKTVELGQLEMLAMQSASTQPQLSRRPGRKPTLVERLDLFEGQLESTYEWFAHAAVEELATSHAGEWILDNVFIIRQAVRLIREDMPQGFYQKLPKLDDGALEGYPRVYWMTRALVSSPNAQLDSENIERFVTAFQTISSLTTGELWALPVMLRFSVLEDLTRATLRIMGHEAEPDQDLPASTTEFQGPNDDTLVANAILNLRALSAMDWKEIVENLSCVEKTLQQDPAGVYGHMDFETRDHYRRIVEEIALAAGQDEEIVAQQAIAFAETFSQIVPLQKEIQPGDPQSGDGRDLIDRVGGKRMAEIQPEGPRLSHVGYYLLDTGRPQLEDRLGIRRSKGRRILDRIAAHRTFHYLGSIGLLSALSLLAILALTIASHESMAMKLTLGLLSLIPCISISVNLVNWFITLLAPVRKLPKMDFQNGIPDAYRTMVVIPSMLSSPAEVDSLLEHLELHFLSNPDRNLYFALLTDFPDAQQEEMPEDRVLLEKTMAGIQELNDRYPSWGIGRFSLFHRKRIWNPSENRWMGWERKRGKLAEFNRLLRGDQNTSYNEIYPAQETLEQVRYVITLDRDTLLPEGCACRLVGTLAHPLNQAYFYPGRGVVLSGYTLLQPRVEIKPTSANQTAFSRIFSGDTALDLYSRAVSDVYQDLFAEGIYVGKGIYDVDAFERSLEGRVPENALLSHDLFEGIHGRAALVTDITLLEDFPPHYLAFAQRLHRWLRGDWQIMPWLFPRVPGADGGKLPNRFSLLSRWKIFDNLRRSLLMPSLLALLITGWVSFPGISWIWSLIVPLILAVPLLTCVGNGLQHLIWRKLRGLPVSFRYSFHFWRWLMAQAFLPFEALLAMHAITSTLFRLWVTRRGMLQWTTSAESVRRLGKLVKPEFPFNQMIAALGFVSVISLTLGLAAPGAFPGALPFLILWLISPQIAHWISQPNLRRTQYLTIGEIKQLRKLARRTWLFFEEFVGPEDHWLPPDHYQENPLGLVAHRTSPTNIGLLLLSTLAAYDLGYVGTSSLIFRLTTTLDTIDQLEHHRGHLLNWYDTRILQPLSPRYVSTVDSGNLAACFLTLKQACLDLPHNPILRWERWQGLLDALSILRETLESLELNDPSRTRKPLLDGIAEFKQQIENVRHNPARWAELWAQLSSSGWESLSQAMKTMLEAAGENLEATDLSNLRTCNDLVHVHLFRVQREYYMLLPWLAAINRPPSLFTTDGIDAAIRNAWTELQKILRPSPTLEEIPAICQRGKKQLDELIACLVNQETPSEEVDVAREWCLWLSGALEDASLEAETLLNNLVELADRIERKVQDMDFSFLYNRRRQVFYIGYHVDTGRLDDNYYDLLASEARLASLVAMAKRDVPQSHWLHLGRPLTQVGGIRMLLSWSGTMFEYLMPSLLVREFEGTLLSQSDYAAVERQMNYALQNSVPWGISESGYYAFDANLFYQYRAFGVPGLGFKRGLAEDLVITPYASLLALPFRPNEVLRNIQRLTALDMQGRYGFYEAADFTSARLSIGNRYALVQSYMAHHQGMILLALANYLLDKRMIRRFHADPRIKGVELLLQERIPYDAPLEEAHRAEVSAIRPQQAKTAITPWSAPILASSPRVHFLSNGQYGILVTSSGGGSSHWQDIDLTRWRADTTLENWGTWIYIKDRDRNTLWSLGYQPTTMQPKNHNVSFEAHKAEFWRQDGDISSRMEITIVPDENVEIRKVRLTNQGSETRRLFLTSYAEVVLADQASDRRHPAFNKMFIECEYLFEQNALLYRRRPRSVNEKPIYMAHLLIRKPGNNLTRAYEADRAQFIGRGRTARNPLALDPTGSGLSGTIGATLDPIMALGQEVDLAPRSSEQLAWITLAAPSRDEALALIERYRSWPTMAQSFERARSHIELDLRRSGYSSSELENIDKLLGALLFPHPSLRAAPARIAANLKGQAGLWPHTISGDHPILLLLISSQEETSILIELLRAHAYWRKRGLKIDLVVLNEHETGYSQDLSNHLFRTVSRMDGEAWLNRRGGIFLLRADQMGEADRILLETAARVVLFGNAGSLADQLNRPFPQPTRLPNLVPILNVPRGSASTHPIARPESLLFDNGLGGFDHEGREYVIYLQPGQHTPAPWINVISNQVFGFLVSESGLGCTWSENSGENRLTPWSNDPVCDTPGEVLYLRDEETGAIWTPTPRPAGAQAPYLIRHGAGYSIFGHHSYDLQQELKLYTVPDEPLKVVRLTLRNTSDRNRRITATYYAEWVLGADRDQQQMYIIPEFDNRTQAILARNPYNTDFAGRMAFLAGNKPIHGLTGDRTGFLGRMWSYEHPASLNLVGLNGILQAGLDPCAAIMLHIDLAPGGSEEVYFLLGQGEARENAIALVERYQNPGEVEKAWQALHEHWDGLLDTVQVKTPEPAMDLLLNRWLLYQSLACRIWGRTAFYQSSGAYGFRDQLQDVMAAIHTAPEIARQQILEAARHQFQEGDVLHWWHPPAGRGVRTRISDDLLWLPYVTSYYVRTTGDVGILQEEVPLLKADILEPDEEERYGQYPTAQDSFSLYQHCLRAVGRASTAGQHGIPLIGTGDWNDGMNRVGIDGQGESVWLGWFLYTTLKDFMPICEQMGDNETSHSFRQQALELRKSLEEEAWDGAWYLRAFYDDGTPIGSSKNRENQIDSLAQSWSVLSHAADLQRSQRAMDSVMEKLVCREDGLILLFTPPFDKTPQDPGYIKGYLPGIRENGGQYTHGAQWVIWALAELGRTAEAEELFRLINPIHHGQDPQKYRVEPYVVPADIYSTPPHTGRGGWTWYTGSAAWIYRLGLEGILGLHRLGNALKLDPRIPPSWPGFKIHYRHGKSLYRIDVDNPEGAKQGVQRVTLDGNLLADGVIPLVDDDKEHDVRVVMGQQG
jgi:cyclic beta-1,2-glucan synthetase